MKQKSLDILGSDFNSTMVRLKAQFANPYPQMEMDFNSTMVRLKELDVKRYGAMGRNFNSTMVRLKEPACSVQPNQHLFQFHYGTIKSYRNDESVRYKTGIFQFHYGTIKRQGECCYSWSNNYISIPLWYD